ncbi:beta-glucosidase 24-like [Mercurialis annua]|uniref:beta-glucosidase 24-like n=1 Tax=Mercurialis annua TaxID=3986 RepID=UPI00215F31F4|nr:beta-glucosidase 24-like [Mercurialis annua]
MEATIPELDPDHLLVFNSSYFPDDFLWGTGISAYQMEGAADKREVNIWDTFARDYPERIADGSNGDIATEFYYNYKNDIKRMKEEVGTNAFRFSIAWSRVIPGGNISAGVSEEGIDFYNSVIDETIKNGMVPFVTIFHWDVPQELECNYGGFRSRNIVSDYKDFAELCFQRFGDRVKYWATFNEPHIFTSQGYDLGILAPGRGSAWVNKACTEGDSGTEPYIVAHNLLLAHAAAVATYKEQGFDGKIGITLDITGAKSFSNTSNDIESVNRYLDFTFGWFMKPISDGEYPEIMRELVGDRLPAFNEAESTSLKGSYDFIEQDINGTYIGVKGSPDWLYVAPEGLESSLKYIKDAYENPIIYITENGIADGIDLSAKDALKDKWRISYHKQHLWKLLIAMSNEGVRVKGYFVWAFIDNFEWAYGYTLRTGLYANNNLTRTPKLSVKWFKKFLEGKGSTSKHSHLEDKEEL